jgi:hypothetical protein
LISCSLRGTVSCHCRSALERRRLWLDGLPRLRRRPRRRPDVHLGNHRRAVMRARAQPRPRCDRTSNIPNGGERSPSRNTRMPKGRSTRVSDRSDIVRHRDYCRCEAMAGKQYRRLLRAGSDVQARLKQRVSRWSLPRWAGAQPGSQPSAAEPLRMVVQHAR